MYAAAQTSIISAVNIGSGKRTTSAKTDKTSGGFADILTQKNESQIQDNTTNNQVETAGKEDNTANNASKDTADKDTDGKQDNEMKNKTEDNLDAAAQEVAVALKAQMLFVAPVVDSSGPLSAETAGEDGMMAAAEVQTPLPAQDASEELPVLSKTPSSSVKGEAMMQELPKQPAEQVKESKPEAVMPKIQDSSTPTETSAVQPDAAFSKEDEESGKVKQETVDQPMMALQNMEGAQQDELKVKIPVSDSASLLQRHTTQQLSDQIISRFKDGNQQFTLNLHPERLGQVTVNMLFESGQLVVKVETHSQLAQNVLAGGLVELKNVLADNGVQVGEVEISAYAEQRQDAQESSQHPNGRQQRGQQVHGGDESYTEEANKASEAERLLDYSI